MSKRPTAYVDPRFRIPYYTWILQGFQDLDIPFLFKRLNVPAGGGMAFQYRGKNFWIDTDDMSRVEEAPYEWADVLGKVNCLPSDIPKFPKLVPIGPTFGIQFWSLPFGYLQIPQLIVHGASFRTSLAGLRFQGIGRLPLSRYEKFRGLQSQEVVYHRSRKWEAKHDDANHARLRFIEAMEDFDVIRETELTDTLIPLEEYLTKTSQSMFVFNSPAVHRCLGWKLGEYLALGKAILSVPFENALPAPLVHGEHIHYTEDDVASMRDAIDLLIGDIEYRRHLENGAHSWFRTHLTPSAVVSSLISRSLL